jgi:mannose/fructose-specific phosphotransferase system component IIA
MEWGPLLIVLLVMENSRIVNLLQGLSLPLLALLLLSNRKDKLKFCDSDWATGQPSNFC